jgi:UDP-galactopyranose mutase
MTATPPGTELTLLSRGSKPRRPLLLCLSHLRWDFVFQRPQHLLTRAARDYDVVFFEEPEYGEGPARLATREAVPGVTIAVPRLPSGLPAAAVTAAQREALEAMLAADGRTPALAWFYTPMALEFASGLQADTTVYDCMDELSAFRGAPPRMLELERALLARADLVFTGGRSLYEAKRSRHRRVSCFPSSIDVAHFAAARRHGADPAEQAGLGRPRIGFFGVIDERMDTGLVGALAALRPEWSFVMIGPVVKIDPADLPRRDNLHWLGARSYPELPTWLGGWDAGFMPFARNESTRFISPTKTPEFLAAGLPVVSTPITDVVRDWGPGGSGVVEIAEDAEGFAEAIERMLARPREPWLRRVDRQLALLSWDRSWAEMKGLIDTVSRPARQIGGGQVAAVQVAAARGASHA